MNLIKSTILGQHIRLIRPEQIKQPIISRKDLPVASYNKQPRIIKEHTGKVVAVCVKLVSGGIRGLTKGTHLHVITTFGIDPDNVVATGWELDNGNHIWR